MSFEIQPLIPSPISESIESKAFQLISLTSEMKGRLHEVTAIQISNLVQVINCYYSNLIEGHRTKLKDLEEARKDKGNEKKLSLSKAHIQTQSRIRNDGVYDIFKIEYIRSIHEIFYSLLPDCHTEIKGDGDVIIERIQPGEIRKRPVQVGKHIPPESHDEIVSYFEIWKDSYSSLSNLQKVSLMGAIHHRLAWIHPFLDGNGRVVRLFNDKLLMVLGLDHYGVWSLSRGLARNKEEYFQNLALCDESRYNDLDGRGALSQKNLLNCCEFFLETALDQVEYMKSLYELDRINQRYKFLMNDLGLEKENADMLSMVFTRGQLDRGEFVRLYPGKKERAARNQLSILLKHELLVSDTPKSPLKVNFPLKHLEILMPRLLS